MAVTVIGSEQDIVALLVLTGLALVVFVIVLLLELFVRRIIDASGAATHCSVAKRAWCPLPALESSSSRHEGLVVWPVRAFLECGQYRPVGA